jgi:hypothetical protein
MASAWTRGAVSFSLAAVAAGFWAAGEHSIASDEAPAQGAAVATAQVEDFESFDAIAASDATAHEAGDRSAQGGDLKQAEAMQQRRLASAREAEGYSGARPAGESETLDGTQVAQSEGAAGAAVAQAGEAAAGGSGAAATGGGGLFGMGTTGTVAVAGGGAAAGIGGGVAAANSDDDDDDATSPAK